MRPSEILHASRDAALRVRSIEDEVVELRDRIGVQGHTYGIHSKNGILDPMRKVDDMIDQSADLRKERAECHAQMLCGQLMIDGARECLSETSEYVMRQYYVRGRSVPEISRAIGRREQLCLAIIGAGTDACDSQGCARLKARAMGAW